MKPKLIAALLPLLGAASGFAQTVAVPALLSYQGRVTDSAGNLIGSTTPANRAVKFQIYTASSGGSPVWAETQTVTISGGEFSVLIGNGTGISGINGPSAPAPTPFKTLKDIFNSSGYTTFYLGVTVDDGNATTTDAEISPRQQLVSGAFALRAAVAETVASSAVTTSMVADSSITTGKIADSNVTSAKIADLSIAAADLAAGAVTSAKIDTSTVGLWNVNGANVYRSSGNVGIGVSSPTAPLYVAASANTSPDTNGIYVYNPTNSANNHAIVGVRTAGSSAGNPLYSMDVAGVNGWSMGIDNSDSQKFKLSNAWNALTNPKLTVSTAGNIGIGTTTPGFPLNFADTLGDKISLWGQSGSTYGFGIQSSLLQIHSDSSGSDIALGYGASGTFTERMRVKGNGYVGIGTSNPTQKLTIDSGWIGINAADGTEYGITGTMAGSDAWSIYGTGSANNGTLVIRTYDDGNEPIAFYQNSTYRGGVASDGNLETGEGMALRLNGSYGGSQCDANLSTGTNGGFTIAVYNASQNRNIWRYAVYDGDSNWDFSSDVRLKTDIVDAEPMLDRLLQVRFRRFHWKDGDLSAPLSFGVIAQELEPIFPLLVTDRALPNQSEVTKTVAYTEFATIAAKSVQELKARNDAEFATLHDEIAAKDARIADLEARLAAIEKLLSSAK